MLQVADPRAYGRLSDIQAFRSPDEASVETISTKSGGPATLRTCCPRDWMNLPVPDGRIVIGLDGGYVRDRDDRKKNFELIVGRSLPEDGDPRYIGFVHGYDWKPQRRITRR